MAQLMLINPKRRTRRAASSSPKRRRRTVARVAAPRRRRHVARVAHNPIRRRRHHTMSRRRIRRNPIEGGMGGTIMSAVIGAAGAVAVDMVAGYLPVPASMMTGYGPYLVKGALGLGMGMFRNQTLKRMGAGALLVAAYGALKTATAGMLPAAATAPAVAGMGFVNPSMSMGQITTGPQSGMHGMGGMGEFVSSGGQQSPFYNY
ncbi:MAG: hypothetical protein ACYDHF_07960 [Candidatus Cryosericum sp.]